MTTDLFPCPFCGCTRVEMIDARRFGSDYGSAVECQSCNAAGPIMDTEAAATATWNKALRGNEHQQTLVAANRKLLIELHDLRTFGK